MYKTYSLRLYPNREQRQLLSKMFGCVRWIYNWALGEQKFAYNDCKVRLSRFDLQNCLPELKKREATSWLKDADAQSLQSSLADLDTAWKNKFKHGFGFPKFKKRSERQSVSFPQRATINFEHKSIKLPKLKGVRYRDPRVFSGTIKTVTVVKTPSGKYFAQVLVDDSVKEPIKFPILPETTLGIDAGLKDFVTTSDGRKFKSPDYKNIDRKIKREQRIFSRKTKGSSNRQKQIRLLARYHEKKVNIRLDFLHKLSHALINENQVNSIAIEDLNVRGMVKNRKLSKAISNASWSTFFGMLDYKAKKLGKNVLKINRFAPSSKTCSNCGHIYSELTLKERTWECSNCNTIHDRDINAAKNIRDFAVINLGKAIPEDTLVEIQ